MLLAQLSEQALRGMAQGTREKQCMVRGKRGYGGALRVRGKQALVQEEEDGRMPRGRLRARRRNEIQGKWSSDLVRASSCLEG